MKKNYMIKVVAITWFLLIALMQTVQAENSNGHFWLKLQDKNVGMDDAVRHFGEWLNLPSGSTFELLGDETDELGIRHLRYRQYVEGYEVQASMVMVHGRNGIVTSANGVVMEQTAQPTARRKALARRSDGTTSAEELFLVQTSTGYRYATYHYDPMQNAEIYADAETGEVLKALSLTQSVSEMMQGRSLYSGTVPFSVTTLTDGRHVMADSTRNIYTVDAHKAEENVGPFLPSSTTVHDRERYIQEHCTAFSTKDNFWIMPQLIEYSIDSICSLNDPFAEIYLVLHNYKGDEINRTDTIYATSIPYSVQLKSNGGASILWNIDTVRIEVWKYNYVGDDERIDCIDMDAVSSGKHDWKTDVTSGHVSYEAVGNPAVDIHWGMQQTYDWYKKSFGRNSYDGKGGPIYNVFLAPKRNPYIGLADTNNAGANHDKRFNCPVMIYGIGDGIEMRPVVAIDIMAHEFTHLVTHYTAGLEGGRSESGALNESFSDIIGISVKKAVKGSKVADNWLIGDDVMLQVPCIRDMSHRIASSTVAPIYYKGKDWVDGADEHANCAVQNYWFYLLCEAKDLELFVDYGWYETYSGIGIEKAVQIAYRNLTHYLSPTSNYLDARKGSLLAAADLYGEDSEEYMTVLTCWNYVGVTEATTPPTAISNVTHETKDTKGYVWYNLQGQRIGQPSQPGVYIWNGKKVIIK